MGKEGQACQPPPEFMAFYEELWERAFGGGSQWVYDSTCGGTFSLRRRSFRVVLKDERAPDDILMLDSLFREVAKAVRIESGRVKDEAEWHKDIKQVMAIWKKRGKGA